eukprot:m.6373 g.6373  ORF g.6373 m.6373 type:complete len:71 (+) comp3521_c0_seq2:818-1030(+)
MIIPDFMTEFPPDTMMLSDLIPRIIHTIADHIGDTIEQIRFPFVQLSATLVAYQLQNSSCPCQSLVFLLL